MKLFLLFIFTIILAGIAMIFEGFISVGADDPHSRVMRWVLSTAMHQSVERGAKEIEAPNLKDETLWLAGASDYDAMCAVCHTPPGFDPSPIAQGLNPPPPDLSHAVEHMNAAEQFWVVKHGIKMTGMPAWGISHSDADLWRIVAFMQQLPDLNSAEYKALQERAKHMGHHEPNSHHTHATPITNANDRTSIQESITERSSVAKDANKPYGDNHDH